MRFIHFTEKWLKEKQGKVKSVSLSTYQRLIESYMIPFLGNYETEQITDEVLEEFNNYLAKLGLSDITRGNVMRVLKSMLCPKKTNQSELKTEKYLDKADLDRLVNYLKKNESKNNIMILLAVLTGLGPGELCGIQGKNINFHNNTILINSVVNRIKANKDEISKTTIIECESTHIRTIELSKWAMDYLKKIKTKSTFYLVSANKNPVDSRSLQYNLQKISKELNIDVTFKILQSTFIVNCLKNGANLYQIATFLGTTTKQLERRGYKENTNFEGILRFQEEFGH